VCNKVSVRPFDRVANLRRHLRWCESKILNLNLDDGSVGRSGEKYEQGSDARPSRYAKRKRKTACVGSEPGRPEFHASRPLAAN
jgi:hypothetical protein